MTEAFRLRGSGKGLAVGRIAFMAALVVAGTGLLGWAAVRRLTPPPAPPDLAAQARTYLRERNVVPLSGPLEALLADPSQDLVQTQEHPLRDGPAPRFELSDPADKTVRLDDLLAKGPVVLVFYYGYRCNHCVSQLFALNDDLAKFHELGAEVVAVSADPPELTRQRFKKYGEFAFPVLSDPENKVAQAYAVFTPAQGRGEASLYHGTFVIGRDGMIRWAMRSEAPFTNNRTLLHEIARLEGRLPAENAK